MKRMNGKTAIVTGAAKGMGLCHARMLAAEGASVALTDIDSEGGEAAVRDIGGATKFYRHDVSSAESWDLLVQQVEKDFGPVSVLVNNAGIGYPVPVEKLDEAQYRRFFEINELGCFLGIKAVLDSMRNARSGSIVNISSACGIQALDETIAYTATKFAVRGMTKAAALDLAKYNIRVNSVHPALTRTDMCRPETVGDLLDSVPLRRIGEPEEVSSVVLFLASDESSYCTGAEFVVDGGFTAGH
ncbi:glucose 1-dehydrogenase [Altericroceibacterium spongiae]|uniref:Glucose 1-dehydrogenase n=1 Tax=Altericroceibacterium spongiae TaxID=2320269 RepID=A0A420EQZ7_9SPHN|nr:glucose 1-dehydrogenase [Altericroceibacterium spongiae]RKF23099.1 glucose 1-dehydrogenase [Altericroceibacterium spongiae]